MSRKKTTNRDENIFDMYDGEHKKSRLPSFELSRATINYAVFAVIALSIALVWLMTERTPLDRNNCPVGKVPSRNVYILSDLTNNSGASQNQLRVIFREIDHVAESLKAGDRLSIGVLVAKHKNQTASVNRLLTVCRPPHPDEVDVSTTSRIAAGKKFRKEWIDAIKQVKNDIINLNPNGSTTSPILASIKEIGTLEYLDARKSSELLILSDLVENSSRIKQHKKNWPSFAALEKRKDDLVDVKDLFVKTKVIFKQLVVSRYSRLQLSKRYTDFWENWSKKATGKTIVLTRIY